MDWIEGQGHRVSIMGYDEAMVMLWPLNVLSCWHTDGLQAQQVYETWQESHMNRVTQGP